MVETFLRYLCQPSVWQRRASFGINRASKNGAREGDTRPVLSCAIISGAEVSAHRVMRASYTLHAAEFLTDYP